MKAENPGMPIISSQISLCADFVGPGLSFSEFSKKLGEKWKSLSTEDKAPYGALTARMQLARWRPLWRKSDRVLHRDDVC